MPDKAIDLIDEAASKLRMQQESKPEAVDMLERELIRYASSIASSIPPSLLSFPSKHLPMILLLTIPSLPPSLPPSLLGNKSRSRH